MTRIAFLDQYAGLGGGQQVLLDLARFFRCAGDAVTVHLPGSGHTSKTLVAEGFAVCDLPLPPMTPGRKPLWEKALYPARALRASRALVRDLAGRETDLLYANGPRTFLPAVLAARELGIGAFCALHLIFPGGSERRLIRWCLSRTEVRGVLFCSRAVAAPFRDTPREKVLLAPYWVSPRFLESPRGPGIRQELGIPADAVAVGAIGRISPTKGQRLFLEALTPLLPEMPRLHLAIAGSADFESREEERLLSRLRDASPDPGRIHLHFRMVDSLAFMDSLDILAVPSLWEEPFGLVAVEGMARRLPVVVTRSGGLAETVLDGKTGLIAEKDAASLRERVTALAENPALREDMGRAARAAAETIHHPARCLERLRRFVLECAKPRASAAHGAPEG